jgi:hypothetical protein
MQFVSGLRLGIVEKVKGKQNNAISHRVAV